VKKNFKKLRKLLRDFLDKLQSLESCKEKSFFQPLLYKTYYDLLGKVQYINEPNFDVESIISFSRNILKSLNRQGPRKEFITYLTENPNKPQLVNTNKKYP
jgi:hypothetical protein